MDTNDIQYMQGADFTKSLKALMQRGGQYQKAGERVKQAWANAHMGGHSYKEVFASLTTTNNGENRIENCVKFDLTGYARLVTAYSSNVCIFLFAGSHEDVDAWLDKNKGMDFIAKKQGECLRVEPVFVSDTRPGKHGLIRSETDWMTNGPVIDLLPARYRDKLIKGLDDSVVEAIRSIETDSGEDAIEAVVSLIEDHELSYALLDVLLALSSADIIKAKGRIDLLERTAVPVAELSKLETDRIISSDTVVRLGDLPIDLFEHFVKTADFKTWMLFLHPDQREFVNRDFSGPTRLSGVSGSGKTCVVIHRALRLSKQYAEKRVLILTLNEALAQLIGELVHAAAGDTRPKNLEIKSVFELCREKLIELEPTKRDYYVKRIVLRNEFAEVEHIDDIWDEYYHCQANNHDADAMFDVIRTLLARNVLPQDYLRQELDYVRSAFAHNDRSGYLSMEREGRVVPLERRYREMVISGLVGWERKMSAVGAIDDLGIVTALCAHLNVLKPEFDHVLVDEVQDLGTLELRIIRRLTLPGVNDLFLCGDAAQTVHTKYFNIKDAEIDLPPARCIKLSQNYRNSRQILTAAYEVLTRTFSSIPSGTVDVEILQPEFANFTSAKPLLLSASSIREELAMALTYARDNLAAAPNHKVCIALCGYSQAAIEQLAASLGLPALCGNTNLSSRSLFLSDLEQTKGFEFDLMIVLNCGNLVIPHPDLPEHESFRELFKLYVALTRAKTELVVSYHDGLSRFVEVAKDFFNGGQWEEHVTKPEDLARVVWPSPTLHQMGNVSNWAVVGRDFLKMREAVGLSQVVQDEILQHVTGANKTERSGGKARKIEWREFNVFFEDMESPIVRNGIMGNVAWQELRDRLAPLIQEDDEDVPGETRAVHAGDSSAADPEPVKHATDLAPARAERLKLHRHGDVLKFSQRQLSAHTLASFLVAQGVREVERLEVGRPMPYSVLGFLIPRQELAYWLQRQHIRQLRTNANEMVLTKLGWDECRQRVAENSVALAATNHVEAGEVARSREIILLGQNAINVPTKFYERSFEVMLKVDEALA